MLIKPLAVFFLFLAVMLAIIFNVTAHPLSVIIFLIILLFLLWKKSFKTAGVVFFTFIILMFIPLNPTPTAPKQDQFVLQIYKVRTNYSLGYDITSNINYLLYIEKEDVKRGDIIQVSGKISKLNGPSVSNLFDFSYYLNLQKVFYQIQISSYSKIEENLHLVDQIKQSILQNQDEQTVKLLDLLLFASTQSEEELVDNLAELSLIHIITVSGLQINLLITLIGYILKKFYSKDTKLLSFIIITPYILFLEFAISATRALYVSVVKYLSKRFNLQLNGLDILASCGIIFILFNPLVIFSYSFIYSFTLLFFIELIKPFFKDFKSVEKGFVFSFSAFYILLPITIYQNFQFTPLTIFLTTLLAFPTLVFYLLGWVCLIFPPSSIILVNYYYFYLQLLSFFKYFSVSLIVGQPSIYLMMIYYILLLFIIIVYQTRRKKYFRNLVIGLNGLILLQYFSYYLNPISSLHFIDVGQGDSLLIKKKFQTGAILIDTGGINSYDLATKRTIPYLKSLGIKSLQAIFITHPDFDHGGAKDDIVNNFIVQQVIEERIPSYSIGGIYFQNLNMWEWNDENDNSLVLYFTIEDKSILVTGDISQKVEEKIITTYPSLKVDILKVGHHGSNTSTSKKFIDAIAPEYAIISCGINNRYNHPHQSTLDTLNQYKIKTLRTDLSGTIIFEFRLFSVIISVCRKSEQSSS